MNNYQRYMNTVRGESTDILPRIPILMHFAARYAGQTYGDFARDHHAMVKANIRLVEDFDIEQLDVMSDPWRETVDLGGGIEYLDDAVPKCTRHPMEDTRDLHTLPMPDPYSAERMLNCLRGIRAYKAYGFHEYSITGWVEGPAAEASDVRGVANFMMDLVDDQPFATALMDHCLELAIRFARAQVEEGADTIGVGDAIASQVSPEMYRHLIFPREKQLVEAIHDAGGLVRLHICGNTSHLLKDFAELGVDILDLDWMVDMADARSVVGKKVTLSGNLDPVNAVMKSDPDTIHAAFCDLYKKVGPPYMVNAGCELPVGTPKENLQALCRPIPFE